MQAFQSESQMQTIHTSATIVFSVSTFSVINLFIHHIC